MRFAYSSNPEIMEMLLAVDLPGFAQSGGGLNPTDPSRNRKLRGIRKLIEEGEPGAKEALDRFTGVKLPLV